MPRSTMKKSISLVLKQHEKVCNKTFIQKDALEKHEMMHKGEEPYQHFTGPEQAVKLNQVDASSSQKVYSQRDPAIWLNIKEEPVDEDSHVTMFDTVVQQPTESEEDIEKVQVKEELNFEEITIKEEFIIQLNLSILRRLVMHPLKFSSR